MKRFLPLLLGPRVVLAASFVQLLPGRRPAAAAAVQPREEQAGHVRGRLPRRAHRGVRVRVHHAGGGAAGRGQDAAGEEGERRG